MIVEIILGFSVLLNMTLSWYIYKLLRNLISLEDNFLELRAKLIEFATHLKGINKVESFYGDPTITKLVEHMKALAKDIEAYSDVIVVFEDDMEEIKNDERKED